jgi:hypothetical protein
MYEETFFLGGGGGGGGFRFTEKLAGKKTKKVAFGFFKENGFLLPQRERERERERKSGSRDKKLSKEIVEEEK